MTQYKYITDTGAIVADTATLLTEVQNEYKVALGASLDLAASTPQGTLITGETLARTEVMRNNAELANMINPNLAYGAFLDAVAYFLGISRGSDQSTVGTDIEITGDNLTVIPAGSRVSTADNDVFVTVDPVTIDFTGTALVAIRSQEFGEIPLPVGPLSIIDGTIGWGTAEVTLASSVVLGSLAMKDPQFKNFRTQTLFNQGIGSSGAISAAALAVPNVTSVKVVENNTGAIGVVNGVDFTLPNAMWVCIAGTASHLDIANALYAAHSAGCPWDYGTASGTPVGSPDGIAVQDPYTDLFYRVKWTNPILYDCYVNISVAQATSVTSPEPAVQAAIMAYVNGELQGEPGFVISANVSAFELAGAVSRQLPGLYTKNCAVCVLPAGSPPPVYPAGFVTEFVMDMFGQATLNINDITVNIVP